MSQQADKTTPEKRPWSFLAYIAADNNLSDNGLIDIEELCNTGSNRNVYAAVQIDTYGEHTGSIRYEITAKDHEGQAHRTVIQRLREQDSGNPLVLQNFLRWGIRRYPTDKRLAVIWNHGSGFRSVRRDIGYDDFGSSMDMPEVAGALLAAGITPNNKLAVLGFDACLMNMLEIAHHFIDQAEYLVGSQQTEPADGWPYDQVLAAMHEDPSAELLAKKIVDAYINSYRSTHMPGVTQSAIHLPATEAAVATLSQLGEKLASVTAKSRAVIRSLRRSVQSYEYADYVDAVHLAELAKPHLGTAAAEVDNFLTAARRAVVANGCYGDAVKDSNGLSVWFPTGTALYDQHRAKYLELRCNAKYRGWVQFLDAYYG